MTAAPASGRVKTEMLTVVRSIPPGSVVTLDRLADHLVVIPTLVATLLANLTSDERDVVPWYRVVAKGGAIGRGPHRDAQFAKLVREGVSVSPAGIVQDMGRVAVQDLDAPPAGTTRKHEPSAHAQAVGLGRSRGMKDRPS
jgi:methylated-DNA-protein-cysteine methyltransferase related protein